MYKRRGVNHILAEKGGVSFTLFKKMHENAIFSQKRGGVRRLRPMLDPPLIVVISSGIVFIRQNLTSTVVRF